ncbi:unnamed protein product, partial [Sphenostylis stenocarpa]
LTALDLSSDSGQFSLERGMLQLRGILGFYIAKEMELTHEREVLEICVDSSYITWLRAFTRPDEVHEIMKVGPRAEVA